MAAQYLNNVQINNKADWTQNEHIEDVLADTTSFMHKWEKEKKKTGNVLLSFLTTEDK